MYLSDIGTIAILLALAGAVWSGGAAVAGVKWQRAELVVSARRGVYLVIALELVAALTLILSFLTHDFGLRYVAERSSLDMPWYYIAAAFYGGQEGSLLFWSLTLAVFSTIAVRRYHQTHQALLPYVIAVLMTIQTFFLFLLAFVSTPFERLNFTPSDGAGLNPILRDWGMLIHPPMLLIGYMSVSIPFAFAMAALLSGRLDNEWIKVSRRWILASWIFLSLGNLLGSWWAYHVLGWGGYWGWDPVENSAFMPWLAMSALLHSVLVQDRRGVLKIWTMGLVILSFGLSIFGTFLVRSGVIASVHSFSLSAFGPFFFFFLGLVLIVPVGLLVWRSPHLKSERPMDSLLSRESSFLFNNMLLITIALVTFWGTVFPLVSEAVTGNKATVGKPFYDQANGPIFLALVFLMGLGPLIPWRKASRDTLLRNLMWPVATGGVAATVLVILGMREPAVVLAYAVCAFVVAGIVLEFYRGGRVRRMQTSENWPLALIRLPWRYQSRYGGYLVHLGIILITVGVVSSSVYKLNQQVALKPGESVTVGSYTLTFPGARQGLEGATQIIVAPLHILRAGDKTPETILPEKRIYPNFENQPTTGVAIHSTASEDLYVVFNSLGEDGSVSFFVFVNPMVIWIWLGGGLLLFGGVISWYPKTGRKEPRAVSSVRTLPPTTPVDVEVAVAR